MANQVVSQSIAFIVVMTGRFGSTETLDEQSLSKLERARQVADVFRQQNPTKEYSYIFPDCSRRNNEGQRVCDVMRLHVLSHDPYCRGVEVPAPDASFVSDTERSSFVSQVRGRVVGDCLMLM